MKSSMVFTIAAMLSSGAFAQQQPQPYTPPPTNTPQASTATQETPASSAQSANVEEIFNKLNVSHTGKMTKAEAQAHPVVAANFDAADTNHDGVLTKDEFMAAFRPAQ